MASFSLKVITLAGIFFDEEVERIVLRTINGDIGVLRGHAPLVSLIDNGKLKIRKEGLTKEAIINGGYVEIEKEETLIVCDAAQWVTI